MLTPKQERFCQAIADGNSQADAYRIAYNTKNAKAATIQKRASELCQKGDIAGRVKELQDKLADKEIYTREEGLKMLKDIACSQLKVALSSDNGSSKSAGAAIKAIAEMNRMCGYYEADKVENTISIDFGGTEEYAR